MSLAVGARFAGYEIHGPLGAGGMGEVYRARDVRLRRDVAIKVLPDAFTRDSDRIERFEREARALASLNHPNIAILYGVEEERGVSALVMEFIDGSTLADRLQGGRLPVAEALGIARQLVEALDAAHERGIVHRDLKPANIKVTPDGVVKVLDFGLAKEADSASTPDMSQSPTVTAHGTLAGVILGTAAYMSPEQTRGQAVDKRADVWAFGCVLYEMLAGRRAFGGDTVSDVMASILRSEPDVNELPETVPHGVRRLLTRLLDKDPKRRLRDIGDARFDLDEASQVRESSAAAPATPPARRWKATAVAALVACAGLAVLAAALGTRRLAPPSAAADLSQATVSQLTNYGGSETAATIAPDGKSFAFISDHGGTTDVWVRQIAGGEPVRLTNDAADEFSPEYAPGGETLYFTRTDATGTAIWTIGAFGGQARKVLNDARSAVPSPDGRMLAWYASAVNNVFSLGVSGADGSNRRTLVSSVLASGGILSASWSPDGHTLAYTSGGLFAPRNLFVIDVRSGATRQVTQFARSAEGIQTAAFLLNGRSLIVSYATATQAQFSNDLGVVDLETGAVDRLTMNVAGSFNVPSVSADGARIVLSASRIERELWKVPYGPDPDANGRAASRIMDASQDPMWTYVSRDGRTLLFTNALAGSRNLWTMPLDGSAKARQITMVPGDAVMHSSLSPDQRSVAFASRATGNSSIWVQNVDGTDLRQLTRDDAADVWPAWSPDGRWIVHGSLRGQAWEIRGVPAVGGPAEKIDDGFFRGDWAAQPDGSGTWIVTSDGGSMVRLLDAEQRRVVWQDRPGQNGLPMFNRDGTRISVPVRMGLDDAIAVDDAATGKKTTAVRFPQQFQTYFRASWADDDRAFVVNHPRMISHIVLLDRLLAGR